MQFYDDMNIEDFISLDGAASYKGPLTMTDEQRDRLLNHHGLTLEDYHSEANTIDDYGIEWSAEIDEFKVDAGHLLRWLGY